MASGKKRRIGKNKAKTRHYYDSGRHHWNKARKIIKHLRRYGGDPASREALKVKLAGMPLHLAREFQKQYNVT